MARKDFNQQILMGGLGKDADVHATESGSLFRIRLATSRTFTTNGEVKTRTEWHSVVYFVTSQAQRDYLARMLVKGACVHVVGETRHEEYEVAGQKRTATVVYASDLTLVSSPASEPSSVAKPESAPATAPVSPAQVAKAANDIDPERFPGFYSF
jgi:single stranded DNA-binding protein